MICSLDHDSHKNKPTGISGSTIKLFALFCMLIDHTAAIVLNDMISYRINTGVYDIATYQQEPLYYIMMIMRCIGRLAFPLFCFLLIEGFSYTRNRYKYTLRLFLFSLISEIPFDYAFRHAFISFGYQNVFFTLTIGLLVLILSEQISIHFAQNVSTHTVLQMVVLIGGALIAQMLRTDYGAFGIVTIYIMNYFRHDRVREYFGGCVILTLCNLMEVFTFAIYPLIKLYNNTRGWNLKYLFYAFYPVHIIILTAISYFLGYR